MGVEDFYKAVGGDYNEVFSQLGDDESIVIFLKKFIAKQEMKELKSLLEKKKYYEAFIITHNMKGYGLNMSLPLLHKAASALCEQLRNGEPSIDVTPLVASLEDAYNKIQDGVKFL